MNYMYIQGTGGVTHRFALPFGIYVWIEFKGWIPDVLVCRVKK